MKWIPLTPEPDKKRKPRIDNTPPRPPQERRELRWRLDPSSQAANALRTLKKNLLMRDDK